VDLKVRIFTARTSL